MGYTKKWIPPVVPISNDLAVWKALFLDVHDNLIAAGLVQSSTPGQLDIDSVSALPADNTYAGFIEYEFDDSAQAAAPVTIKLEYGCGNEGLATYNDRRHARTPNIRATVSVGSGSSTPSYSPQQYFAGSASRTAEFANAYHGVSTLCYNRDVGFLGICYGAGSRNKPGFHEGGYYGSTLTLFVARTVDVSGMPTTDGVLVYSPGLDTMSVEPNRWTNGQIEPAYSQYVASSGGAQPRSRDCAIRLNRNLNTLIEGEIQTQQVFAAAPKLIPLPWVVSYNHLDIPDGSEFSLEVFPGSPQNFVALGRETSMSVDAFVGQNAGLAMLFE